MAINIKPAGFYDSFNVAGLTPAMAARWIDVMHFTARSHRERDFKGGGAAADLVALVTTAAGAGAGHPPDNGSYLKVRTGNAYRGNTVPASPGPNTEVVVMYHWLGHLGKWSISVGFHHAFHDPRKIGGDVNVEANEFVSFTKALVALVYSDLTTSTCFSVRPVDVVIVDDDAPSTVINSDVRRATPIGEIGWIAQKNTSFMSTYFSVADPQRLPLPQRAGYVRGLGWGRPGNLMRPADTNYIVTTLTLN